MCSPDYVHQDDLCSSGMVHLRGSAEIRRIQFFKVFFLIYIFFFGGFCFPADFFFFFSLGVKSVLGNNFVKLLDPKNKTQSNF